MKKFLGDSGKYGLEYLEAKELREYTDDDIIKLTNAFSTELISPSVPWILFERENINKLLKVAKCRKCGRCCLPDKTSPDNPGVIVGENDLIGISQHTKHSLKSLRKIVKVNDDPRYNIGAIYLPLPCMFFNKNERSCKIYAHRPFICRIYPISDDSDGENITIDVHCEYGKEMFQKALKYLREEDRKAHGLTMKEKG